MNSRTQIVHCAEGEKVGGVSLADLVFSQYWIFFCYSSLCIKFLYLKYLEWFASSWLTLTELICIIIVSTL